MSPLALSAGVGCGVLNVQDLENTDEDPAISVHFVLMGITRVTCLPCFANDN